MHTHISKSTVKITNKKQHITQLIISKKLHFSGNFAFYILVSRIEFSVLAACEFSVRLTNCTNLPWLLLRPHHYPLMRCGTICQTILCHCFNSDCTHLLLEWPWRLIKLFNCVLCILLFLNTDSFNIIF